MVRGKFIRSSRLGFPRGAVCHLAYGYDFFADAFGDYASRREPVDLEGMRHAWQNDEIRRHVYERHQAKFPGSRPFAEIAFGPDGEANPNLTQADLPALREQYREQRDEALQGA
jgi:hypothetical protein